MPKNILIVEDEPMVLAIAAEEFEDAGYRVHRAQDADGALAALSAHPTIDLLFTDIRIPGGTDGWALAEAVRQAKPNIAVMYATGFSEDEPRMVTGGVFFRKPYRMLAVIDQADSLLAAG